MVHEFFGEQGDEQPHRRRWEPAPEDIEVTQPDAGHTVDPGKDVRVKLIHVFGGKQGKGKSRI